MLYISLIFLISAIVASENELVTETTPQITAINEAVETTAPIVETTASVSVDTTAPPAVDTMAPAVGTTAPPVPAVDFRKLDQITLKIETKNMVPFGNVPDVNTCAIQVSGNPICLNIFIVMQQANSLFCACVPHEEDFEFVTKSYSFSNGDYAMMYYDLYVVIQPSEVASKYVTVSQSNTCKPEDMQKLSYFFPDPTLTSQGITMYEQCGMSVDKDPRCSSIYSFTFGVKVQCTCLGIVNQCEMGETEPSLASNLYGIVTPPTRQSSSSVNMPTPADLGKHPYAATMGILLVASTFVGFACFTFAIARKTSEVPSTHVITLLHDEYLEDSYEPMPYNLDHEIGMDQIAVCE